MADNDMTITAYHIEHGPKLMYALDARNAVQNYPLEWSLEDWGAKSKAAKPKPPVPTADTPLPVDTDLPDRSKGVPDPLGEHKKR